jgi:hypothetical protein
VRHDCELLSEGEVILVHGSFKGPGHTLHQFTATEFMAGMSEEEKKRFRAFNEDFTHNRSPIEHCIHKVKESSSVTRMPRSSCQRPSGSTIHRSSKDLQQEQEGEDEHALSQRQS